MDKLLAITADSLITDTGILPRPLLFLEDGLITRVTTVHETPAPPHTLHLPGHTLAPGFLDIHIHGAGGADVMEGTPLAVQTVGTMIARHGTTSYLATTITAPIDGTLRALAGIADAIEAAPSPGSAQPIGIHLEGPFLSHSKRGVHPPDLLQPPSIDLFNRLYQAARGHIRLITLAPELPGALDLIAHAAALGIRVSLGHSDAHAAEARAGIAAGAQSTTHTFNGMRGFDHREPGLLGVVLDDQTLFAELIADGIHCTPEAVRLWFRSKGPHCPKPDRAILVSDGMAATGMPNGRYKLGDLDVDVTDGTCTSNGVLAGSVLTLDRAISNLQHFTGTDLATAVHCATRNPAHLLGLPHLATLAAGSPANLNLYAPNGTRTTFLRGHLLP